MNNYLKELQKLMPKSKQQRRKYKLTDAQYLFDIGVPPKQAINIMEKRKC